MELLRADGWEVLELWECRVRAAPEQISEELVAFLGPPRTHGPTVRVKPP
jgi:G:T-mismatch repair DNA endonuclease (very short patch repair protein)